MYAKQSLDKPRLWTDEVNWNSLAIITKGILGGDFKHALHADGSMMSQLEVFCQEEWVKNDKTRIEKLPTGHRKHSQAVIYASKGDIEH